MDHSSVHASLTLPVWGKVQASRDGKAIKLRSKALCILYSLAIDGPTTRGVLAERLWGHMRALENLRSELSYLRNELVALGFKDAFPSGQDPLQLPFGIKLEESFKAGSVPLDALESGFEELTDGFVVWIEEHRQRLLEPRVWQAASRSSLLHSLVLRLPRPGVLFISGLPGSGLSGFVHELARALHLPFMEGLQANAPVLHWLPAPHPAGTLERVLESKTDVFVLEQPMFGETPRVMLELEHRLPQAELLKLHLPGLSWSEARHELLSKLSFVDAARVFLETQGQPEALRESLAFTDSGMPLQPGRMALQFQRELRFLALSSRLALERLSVHPGRLSEALIETMGASAFVDELERRGWLRFETQQTQACWSFQHELARRILYAQLQPGRRHVAHRNAVDHFALYGDVIAESYHRLRSGLELDISSLTANLNVWQQMMLKTWLEPEVLRSMPAMVAASMEAQVFEPEERDLMTTSFERLRDGFAVVRSAALQVDRLRFDPSPKAMILCVTLRAHLENPLLVGLSGFAFPLRLLFSDGRKFGFCHSKTMFESDGTTWISLNETTQAHIVLPAGVSVQLEVGFETGVLEFDLHLLPVSALQHPDLQLHSPAMISHASLLPFDLSETSTSKAV
jgi:hypothetical protein